MNSLTDSQLAILRELVQFAIDNGGADDLNEEAWIDLGGLIKYLDLDC